MSDGFPNKPKILRGAFVEFGLSLPPLVVVFQFNPLQLTRNRSLTFAVPNPPAPAPGTTAVATPTRTLRQFHGQSKYTDLLQLQKDQLVTVQEQSIGFDIRLDATDKLNDGDVITEQFGIAPKIATLEQMVCPKEESLLGAAVSALLGKPEGFSFTRGANPPLVLFIFGRKRVLPVNINSMNITETEFSTDLNPTRATVAVNLTVIEGKSVPYLYSKAMIEAMSVLNLANIAEVANVMIPDSVMFSKISRYRKLDDVTAPDARGRMLAAKDLRLLPEVSGTFRHTVDGGDRLDQLAYKYYGQPLLWWNICDANPEFLSPLALVARDRVVTVRFPVTVASEPPPWAALFRAVSAKLGVEDVEVSEEIQLVPKPVIVAGQTVTTMIEQFSRALLVTYNRLNVTAEAVAATIAAAGFQVGPFTTIDQLGQEIVIPPKPVG